jgi:hypothetical protein
MIMQVYGEQTLEDWPQVDARHSRQRPLLTKVRILAAISVAMTPKLMVSDVQRCPNNRRRDSHMVLFPKLSDRETTGLVERSDSRESFECARQKITGGFSAVVQ